MAAANSSTENRIVRSRIAGQWRRTKAFRGSITQPALSRRGAGAGPEAVTDAGTGLDHVVAAEARELGPEVADVTIDGAVGDGEARTVQAVDDRVAAEDLGGRGHQGAQDHELG